MDTQTGNRAKIISRLSAQCWVAAGLCFMILICGFSAFCVGRPRLNAFQWVLQSAVIIIYLLVLLRYGLKWNYHPDQKVLHSTLGYGTWLTIIRGALIAVLAGYLFQPWPDSEFFPGHLTWIPGLLYTAASMLDFFDGRVARACRQETRLGAFLDINFDALGLLVAPLVAVWYGRLPIAYLGVGLAYYIFSAAIWLRKKSSKPVVEIKPWQGARLIAGCQMGFVGLALLPVVKSQVIMLTAYIMMIPLLAGFVRDWTIVCGYRNLQ